MNKISVIIPTRNRSSHLYRCLQSLSKQTIKPYEVIIVDNASKDNTKCIVKKFRKVLSINYIYLEKIGISRARNAGLKIFSGEIVAFLDDDCTAYKDWIEKIIKNSHYLKKYFIMGVNFNKNYKNILSNYVYLLSLSSVIRKTEEIDGENIIKNYLDTKNAIISRKQLDTLESFFNEEFDKFIYGGDVELGLRLTGLGYSGIIINEIKVIHDYNKNIKSYAKKRFLTGKSLVENKELFNSTVKKTLKLNAYVENIFNKNDLKKVIKSEEKKYRNDLTSLTKIYSKNLLPYDKIILYLISIFDRIIFKYGILYQEVVGKFKKAF